VLRGQAAQGLPRVLPLGERVLLRLRVLPRVLLRVLLQVPSRHGERGEGREEEEKRRKVGPGGREFIYVGGRIAQEDAPGPSLRAAAKEPELPAPPEKAHAVPHHVPHHLHRLDCFAGHSGVQPAHRKLAQQARLGLCAKRLAGHRIHGALHLCRRGQ